jgi:hypothetical protein
MVPQTITICCGIARENRLASAVKETGHGQGSGEIEQGNQEAEGRKAQEAERVEPFDQVDRGTAR